MDYPFLDSTAPHAAARDDVSVSPDAGASREVAAPGDLATMDDHDHAARGTAGPDQDWDRTHDNDPRDFNHDHDRDHDRDRD